MSRRDYNSFKTYNRSSYVKFNGDRPKTYLDYLNESDYSEHWKKFYKRVYNLNKEPQPNLSDKLFNRKTKLT